MLNRESAGHPDYSSLKLGLEHYRCSGIFAASHSADRIHTLRHHWDLDAALRSDPHQATRHVGVDPKIEHGLFMLSRIHRGSAALI